MRGGRLLTLTGAALVLASCNEGDDVSSAQSDVVASAPVDTATLVTTIDADTTAGPTSGAPSTSERPAISAPVNLPTNDEVVFDLQRFDVVVNTRSTTIEGSGEGPSGFFGAAALPDSTLIAHGFDVDPVSGFDSSNTLWYSGDGFTWQRVAPSVGDRPDQLQFIPMLLGDRRGRVVAPVTAFEAGGPGPDTGTDFGLTVTWSTADGPRWGSDSLVGSSLVRNGTSGPDGMVLVGVADPDWDTFTAAVYLEPTGPESWSEATLDPDGASSVANGVVASNGTLVAVGATTRTDPAGSVATTLEEVLADSGPSDVAVWRSTDRTSWVQVETDAFSGKSGPSQAREIVLHDDRLYTLVSSGSTEQTVLDVYASDDLGDSWERLNIPRATDIDIGDNIDLTTTGLYSVGDALLVVEGRAGPDGQRLFMTVVDPVGGDSFTHEISEQLELDVLGDVVEFDGHWLGVGQTTMATGVAATQTVEIHLVEDHSDSASRRP